MPVTVESNKVIISSELGWQVDLREATRELFGLLSALPCEYVAMDFYFYYAEGPWKDNIDRLILLRSKPYTHVEMKFPTGWSFSSSNRDGGCRFKGIDYDRHPQRWHKITLYFTKEQIWRMWLKAATLVRLEVKYDKRGIAGFLITGHHKAWHFFCSEVVYAIIASEILLCDLNYKMHPSMLYKVLFHYWCLTKQFVETQDKNKEETQNVDPIKRNE